MGIDKSNPFDRDPSMQMEYGPGGRDIPIVPAQGGEIEGTSVQDFVNGKKAGDVGHSGDASMN